MSSKNKIMQHNISRTGMRRIREQDIKFIVVLFVYLFVFGIVVPTILFRMGYVTFLEGYMPNLDLIACALGYSGGPYGMFKHIYNPSTETGVGTISAQILNYVALIGSTFLISYYTLKTKSIFHGWGRGFIMIPATYLAPSYFVSYFSYRFGEMLHPYFPIGTMNNWFITVIASLALVVLIVVVEGHVVEMSLSSIVSLLKTISRTIQQS